MTIRTKRRPKSKRRIYGDWKAYPRDYQRQDIRCPHCAGLGESTSSTSEFRDWCCACAGTGRRDVFTARMLEGTVLLDEMGHPYEPHEQPEDMPW